MRAAILLLLVFSIHPQIASADWQDSGRKTSGISPATKNNGNVRYSAGCEAASDNGKWCASRVTVVVAIEHDPEELYRLKYFDPTPANCNAHIYTASGPEAWHRVERCSFDPALRVFKADIVGWTLPQRFAASLDIQQRVPAADWKDSGRQVGATSPATKNNDNVRYSAGCEAASDDGKWCASRVTLVIAIGNDPQELYRLKYFDPTPANCNAVVNTSSGPKAWHRVEYCGLDASQRIFRAEIVGWTLPQTFAASLDIQERAPGDSRR